MTRWWLTVAMVNLRGVVVLLGGLVPQKLVGELGGERQRTN